MKGFHSLYLFLLLSLCAMMTDSSRPQLSRFSLLIPNATAVSSFFVSVVPSGSDKPNRYFDLSQLCGLPFVMVCLEPGGHNRSQCH